MLISLGAASESRLIGSMGALLDFSKLVRAETIQKKVHVSITSTAIPPRLALKC